MFGIKLKILISLCLACLWSYDLAADISKQEIEFLIHSVARSGCEFERNGDRHNAVDAAAHLRLKYRRGRRHANTAERFIDRLATRNSWTGKQYLMVCPHSGEHTANAWLHRALREYREMEK